MEKEENRNAGSVYMTADKDGKPVHISTKGEGNEGLIDFMFEDVEKALHRKEIPTE
ncbi:hypothetical protein [Parabacteroides gordonii]|jgi:hypothetical protein|uniref:hypothetical protein n=1 Tax=Bacteroidales TaxID=171549 RepID=UPI00241EE3CB|nr:hypothetical protein [Parabacteroides gordonii]